MTTISETSFIKRFGKKIIPNKKNELFDVDAVAIFTDIPAILCQYDRHHILIQSTLNTTLNIKLIEEVVDFILKYSTTSRLKSAEIILLTLAQMSKSKILQQVIERERQQTLEALDNINHLVIFVIHQRTFNDENNKNLIESFINCKNVRMLIVSENSDGLDYLSEYFTKIDCKHLAGALEINLLQRAADTLAMYHNVTISAELIKDVYYNLQCYLNKTNYLNELYQLLDRTGASCQSKNLNIKLKLNFDEIILCLAKRFNVAKNCFANTHAQLIANLNESISGFKLQFNLLKNSLINSKMMPLFFIGPKRSGKNYLSNKLANTICGQANTYETSINSQHQKLSELSFRNGKQFLTLKAVIHQSPFATLIFKAFELASKSLQDGIIRLLNEKVLPDDRGINCQNCSFIIISDEMPKDVLSFYEENLKINDSSANLFSLIQSDETDELAVEDSEKLVTVVSTNLKQQLPLTLLKEVSVIPFFPVNRDHLKTALEVSLKELQAKLKKDEVELVYAAEILSFLADKFTNSVCHFDDILHDIETCLSTSRALQSNRGEKQTLSLRLDERGEQLRCVPLSLVPAEHHAL